MHNNEIGWSWQRSVDLGVVKGFLHVEQPHKFHSWNFLKNFGISSGLVTPFINLGHNNI